MEKSVAFFLFFHIRKETTMKLIQRLINEFCYHEIVVTFPMNSFFIQPIELSIQTIVTIANAKLTASHVEKHDGRYRMIFTVCCGPRKWRRITKDAEKYFIYSGSELVSLSMH